MAFLGIVLLALAHLALQAGAQCTDLAPGPAYSCAQQLRFGKCDAPFMMDCPGDGCCARTCGRCGAGGGGVATTTTTTTVVTRVTVVSTSFSCVFQQLSVVAFQQCCAYSYRSSVAARAGVSVEQVTITSITSTTQSTTTTFAGNRRLAQAADDGVDVQTVTKFAAVEGSSEQEDLAATAEQFATEMVESPAETFADNEALAAVPVSVPTESVVQSEPETVEVETEAAAGPGASPTAALDPSVLAALGDETTSGDLEELDTLAEEAPPPTIAPEEDVLPVAAPSPSALDELIPIPILEAAPPPVEQPVPVLDAAPSPTGVAQPVPVPEAAPPPVEQITPVIDAASPQPQSPPEEQPSDNPVPAADDPSEVEEDALPETGAVLPEFPQPEPSQAGA